MTKKPTNSEDTTKGAKKSLLESAGGAIGGYADSLSKFLDPQDLAKLAAASSETREMTAAARKKRALEPLLSAVKSLNEKNVKLINKIVMSYPEFLLDPSVPLVAMAFCTKDSSDKIAQSKPALLNSPYLLLSAVVSGNEYFARKIVEAHPDLLLDTSAKVADISGKEITGLTPVQVAMCAGDEDMVQMMKEVVPELDIHSQFMAISQNRDIGAVEAEQKANALKFKTEEVENVFNLNKIFAEINDASDVDVKAELDDPGTDKDTRLNAALHNFRTQFDTRASNEQIFNPFDLLSAFEFYDEQFDNFNGNEDDKWQRRDLFWRQVIGYMQRHLPACYLQAFTQGIYYITENNEKLKRDFEFRYDKGLYMVPIIGDLNNLGYKYAGWGWSGAGRGGAWTFSKIIANKKIRFGELIYATPWRTDPEGRVRNRVI